MEHFVKDTAKNTGKVFVCSVGAAGTVQGSIAASIPILQSTFGTVVAGVGTIQPAWIGPLVSFSASPLTAFILPVAVTTTTGYLIYTAGKHYLSSDKTEPSIE